MKKFLLSLAVLFITRIAVFAGEGMWLPLLLSMLNEAEMKSMGMKMSAEDIYSVNNGSLKDAIVQFNGGCTAEIISGSGLILTNHHCGYRQIQAHSSMDHNYLEDGFWAMNRQAELPNDGVTATLIARIEDVTELALVGVTDNMDPRIRQSVIDKNLNKIKSSAQIESWQEVMVRPFYNGNQYFLFVTETFRDVRLVGAPPSSIGKFGADTDNWVWPRHTGDFSMFRIYADKDNHPAEYAKTNVPYTPKHFLPISLDGVQEGDFTLVFGFPGRTSEYLPAVAVEQIRDVLDPAKIAIRDKTLNIYNAAMKADKEVKIQYASKQSGLANGWKKWQGEVLGLRSSDGIQKKKKQESSFQKIVALNPDFQQYSSLLPSFTKLYADIQPYALAKSYYDEITGRNVELIRLAGSFSRLVEKYDPNDDKVFNDYRERVKRYLTGYYANYRPAIDEQVFAAQMELIMTKLDPQFIPEDLKKMANSFGGNYQKMASSVFSNSFVSDENQALSLLDLAPGDILKAVQNDPAYALYQAFMNTAQQKISPKFSQYSEEIASLQQKYMKALLEVFPKKHFYPDANSTMRCSYGRVQGYKPRDAVIYSSKTYLEGVMEKYQPGDYEFDVPEKLRKLYANKDYGKYHDHGRMPVCFLGTNHTTGGNSGSPVIDAYGNLIGLNFDRVWEGTMSDYNYDLKLCRNIMVDIRYVLFLVDKYAGAQYLIDEMQFAYPKTGKPKKEEPAIFKRLKKEKSQAAPRNMPAVKQ